MKHFSMAIHLQAGSISIKYQQVAIQKPWKWSILSKHGTSVQSEIAKLPHYKSNKAAAAFDTNQLNTGWTELTNVALGYQDFILAITVSRAAANLVYFGTYTGKVFRVDQANTGNPPAVDITGIGFPVNGFVSCIETDPANADNCFVISFSTALLPDGIYYYNLVSPSGILS